VSRSTCSWPTAPTTRASPGSFGFLQSPPGCTADWFSLLQGYGLTYQDVESSFVNLGDTVYARTGVTVGNFKKALVDDGGKSRLERGTSGEFAGDTFGNYHPANPRIMLVPLVSFLGDTGSNAAFRIEKFGAFWLEGINQGTEGDMGPLHRVRHARWRPGQPAHQPDGRVRDEVDPLTDGW
jgi:hypothetical protein